MSYTLYHGCVKSAIEPIINGEYGVEKSTPIVHPWICANGNDILSLFTREQNLASVRKLVRIAGSGTSLSNPIS